jgi:hypothetical protein
LKKYARGKKAREVHAEQLLKMSTSLLTAFLVIILIAPISTVVAASFNDIHINQKDVFLNLFSTWYGILCLVSETILLSMAIKIKNDALDIYDELYPDVVTNLPKESEG